MRNDLEDAALEPATRARPSGSTLVQAHCDAHGDALRVRADDPRHRASQEAALDRAAALLEAGLAGRARRHRTGRRAPTSWSTREWPLRNLLNLEKVTKSYGVRILLDEVSLGVGEGERIGIVGRNGDGKTTLLNLMAGREAPDTGRVSTSRGLHIGYLDQRDLLDDTHTVREVVLGGHGRPRVGRATRACARWSRCCWPGSPSTARCTGSPVASAAAARWPGCCWPTTTC